MQLNGYTNYLVETQFLRRVGKVCLKNRELYLCYERIEDFLYQKFT